MTRLLLAIFALTLSACHARDAADVDGCEADCGGVEQCHAAAERVAALGCAERWGIEPEDGSFFDFCVGAERSGLSLCPRRISNAETCEQVNSASQVCD